MKKMGYAEGGEINHTYKGHPVRIHKSAMGSGHQYSVDGKRFKTPQEAHSHIDSKLGGSTASHEEDNARLAGGVDRPVKDEDYWAKGGEIEEETPVGEEMPEIDAHIERIRKLTKHIKEIEAKQGSPASEEMVGRIMKKHMSKGGQVANDDLPTADFDPNEFDDLHLDDSLEFHETGANSGDELGDAQEDEDRRDIVKKIMRSRSKKDKMPNPA